MQFRAAVTGKLKPAKYPSFDLEDSHETTKIKIAFSSLSTIVDEEPMDRVFDLDVLRGALKPTVIIDQSH